MLMYVAMRHNLWLHFGVDEHPLASYVDVYQGYRVLTHSHVGVLFFFYPEAPIRLI